jgi:hypothetical protein
MKLAKAQQIKSSAMEKSGGLESDSHMDRMGVQPDWLPVPVVMSRKSILHVFERGRIVDLQTIRHRK